jgi:mono/diheme cytochrome c family protein
MGLPRLPRVCHRMARPTARAAVPVVAALAAGLGLAGLTHSTRAAEDSADQRVDFAKDIQPILQQSCVRCHKPPESGGGPLRGPAGGLRLDDRAAAFKGGKLGKVIVPGSADESLLYKVLKGPARDTNPMPKVKPGEEFKPLPDEQIQTIKRWIDQGAEWPEG